jgi:hypothetical protein
MKVCGRDGQNFNRAAPVHLAERVESVRILAMTSIANAFE